MNFSASIVLSNCESTNRREETIKNLGEFITIDVYGACGSGKIDTHWSDNFGMQHFPSSISKVFKVYNMGLGVTVFSQHVAWLIATQKRVFVSG